MIGLAAGLLQGAAGQCGPLISLFFYQLNLSRAAFLFLINAFFVLVDITYLASLAWHGLYTDERAVQAAGAAFLAMPTLLLAMRFQEKISEELFRKIVLFVLALTGAVLLYRGLRG